MSIRVSIDCFISWFENKLLRNLCLDLGSVTSSFEQIKSMLLLLVKYSKNLRGISSSPPKFAKFCDQINSLALSYTENDLPILPDSEFIRECVSKLRTKLRVTLESSSKVLRKDLGTGNLSTLIRHTIHSILLSLNELEMHARHQQQLTDYLTELKLRTSKPLHALFDKVSLLPAHVTDDEIEVYRRAVSEAKDIYNEAVSVVPIQQILQLKGEAEYIEDEVNRMLGPLRQAARSNKLPVTRKESGSWCRSLLLLLQSPEEELLSKLYAKSAVQEFASTILDIQSADRSDGSRSSGQQRGSFVDLLPKGLFAAVRDLDLELFLAYLSDWQRRADKIAQATASPDFEKSYKRLVKARTGLQKSQESLDKKLAQADAVIAQYAELRRELEACAADLAQVCAEEFQDCQVQVVVPDTIILLGY